jgi:hypothetical protein
MADEGLRKDVQVGIPDLVNKYAKCEQLRNELCGIRMLMVSL